MANIGFIGTGEIAAAMVNALTENGHQITVSKRNNIIAQQLANHSDVEIADNQDVVNKSEIVVLCLMKDVAFDQVPALNFRPDQAVISVMVDVSLDALKTMCEPANDISITIPLPFISGGGCPLPCYPNDRVVKQIFGDDNPVFAVASEQALNAHFAVSAMASTTFQHTKTGADWLAGITGDKQAAEVYLVAMLGGFLKGLSLDGQDRLGGAIASLSTEGGLNSTLRKHMVDQGANDALIEGLDGFRGRLGLPPKG